MNNSENNPEEEVLARSIKQVGESSFLSESRARQIIARVSVPTLSPLSAYLKRKDQGRSIISNFMTSVNVFMSTTAKTGLVALVLVLITVFGYTQLGSRSGDYAMAPADTASQMSVESVSDSQSAKMMSKGSGDVDEAVSIILGGATTEGLMLGEEEADAALIDSDSQELQDLSQSINDNDF